MAVSNYIAGDDCPSYLGPSVDGILELVTGHTSLIKIWDLSEEKCRLSTSIEINEFPDSEVTCVCVVNSSVLAVSLERTVLFFDRNDLSKPQRTFPDCSRDEINHLAVNRKGEFLSVCDDSGEILIMDLSAWKKFKTCRKHDNICSVAIFNSRKAWELISGGLDCCVISWDFSRGRRLSSVDMNDVPCLPANACGNTTVNPPMVHTLCPIGDGPLIAAGLGNGCIALINTSKGNKMDVISMLSVHASSVNTIDYIVLPQQPIESNEATSKDTSHNQQLLISGGNDTTLVTSTLTVASPPQSGDRQKSSSATNRSKQPHPHITGIVKSKVTDHGSKINNCVYCNESRKVYVADLTSKISVYDLSIL